MKPKKQTETMELTIDRGALQKDMKAQAKEAQELVAFARDVEITSSPEYESVGQQLLAVKEEQKNLKAKKDTVLRPLQDAVRALQVLFKPAEDALKAAEGAYKNALVAWQMRVEEERQLAAQRAEEAARKKLGPAAVRKALTSAPEAVEKISGISTRDHWVAIVVDVTKVPREFMIPNQRMLDDTAEATKGTATIPGVRFENQPIVSAGRRG